MVLYGDGNLICLREDGALRIIHGTPDRYDELAGWAVTAAEGGPLLKYPDRTAPVLAGGLLYLQGADRLVCVELIKDE